MAVDGAIADRARAILPVTWDALSRDSRYGDSFLESSVKMVKETIFGQVIDASAEEDLPLRVIDFAAKLVALELITPGIDFWMNEQVTVTTTGTNEVATFVDRPEKLKQLREELLRETRGSAAEVGALIGGIFGFRRSRGAPALSSIDDELLTPSPQEFPRPYVATGRS